MAVGKWESRRVSGISKRNRTGDICSWLSDGTIHYLGRADHQIKLRGFRIELGEVEAALARHASVRQNIAMVREDEPGLSRLVAYVVAAFGKKAQPEELREHLKQSLPHYMIPSAIVILDAFPLTPNGKIDRKSLPVPEQSVVVRTEFVAPQNSREQILAQIWAKVLKVKRVGRHDNFFELGGHSLLVARLLVRIEQQFGRKLTMAAVFEAPTIEKQAALLQGEERQMRAVEIVPIQTAGSRPPLFWIKGGPTFLPLAQKLAADHLFLGVSVEPELAGKLSSPYRLQEVAANLAQAIRQRQPKGPYFLGGFCFFGIIAYEVAHQLTGQGEKVALVVLLDAGLDHLRSFSKWKNLKKFAEEDFKSYLRTRWDYFREDWREILWRRWVNLEYRVSGGRLRTLNQMLYVAHKSYRPQPYSGRIAYFFCTERGFQPNDDRRRGWSQLATGHFEAHQTPATTMAF